MEFLSLKDPPLCHALFHSSLVIKGEYRYKMEDRWALHYYLGKGELVIGQQKQRVEPGSFSITPAGVSSTYEIEGEFPYLYGHFIPQTGEITHRLPRFSMADPFLGELMQKGVDQFSYDPCLGRAILWQILLFLGEKQDGEVVENQHSWVGQARHSITNNLFAPFSLSQFSQDLGITHAHLNRLFKKEWGTTVYQYVMGERMKRIHYFITQTDISLKQIALEAGYDDLQKFNKNCRRYLGNSPRELRKKLKTENDTGESYND